MKIQNLNNTIDIWIKALESYSDHQLFAKPGSASWSVGQVCMHLLSDTRFYLDQIKACVASDDGQHEMPTAAGRTMLSNNDFPDEVLEGAPSNAFIPQPESKAQLIGHLKNLREEMNRAAALISKSPFRGKSKHPGLGYFSADEWLQFADMHFRHHLRQKKRIDEFLKTS